MKYNRDISLSVIWDATTQKCIQLHETASFKRFDNISINNVIGFHCSQNIFW